MKTRDFLTLGAVTVALLLSPHSQVFAGEYSGHNGGACTTACSDFKPYMQFMPKDPNTIISVYINTGERVNMKAGDYVNQPGVFSEKLRDAYNAGKNVWISANKENGSFYDRDDLGGRRDWEVQGKDKADSKLIMDTVSDKTEDFEREGNGLTEDDMPLLKDTPAEEEKEKPELPPNYIRCDVGEGPISQPATPIPSEINVSGTYSVMLTLTPVKPIGFEKLDQKQKDEWYATHQTQQIGPYLTPYGQFLSDHMGEIQALQGQPDSAWQSMQSQIEATIAQPYNLETLTLNDANQKGIQRGGAYTITEYTKTVSLNVQKQTEQYDTYGCDTETYTTWDYERDPETGYYKKDKDTGQYKIIDVEKTRTRYSYRGRITGETYITNITNSGLSWDAGGYPPSNSFQIVTVRCNASELAKLIAATGSTSYSGNTTASSSAQSPKVSGSIATFYNHLTVEFFYEGKDCEHNMSCQLEVRVITNKPNDPSYKPESGDVGESPFGAESKGVRSDHFTFFRDNVENLITNDVWAPNISKMYQDFVVKEATPNATYLTLSKEGTPRGEMFNIEDVHNNVVIDGNKFPTINYYVAKQKENQFNWKASWSTDQDYPHKANIKYGYRLHVVTTVPTLNASGIVGTSTKSDEFIDVFCGMLIDKRQPNKPTVYNKPDEYDYKPFTEFDNTKGKYITVDFVKTSAE